MENAQVTFDLGWLITAVFIPIIIYLFKRVKDAEKSTSDVAEKLSQYKLDAADKFASVGHLQEVEKRLVDELKGLRQDIKELTTAMNLLAAKGA